MTDEPPADLLTVELEILSEDAVVVRLKGEVDISSAGLMSEHFEAIAGRRATSAILDATEVTFMDSTGVHALVQGKRILHEHGSRIFLVPSQQVRRILDLIFPDPLFAARLNSIEEALGAIDQVNSDSASGPNNSHDSPATHQQRAGTA